MRRRPRVIVAAVGLAFVLAIGLGATGALTPKSQRVALGASTTLSIISGQVQVRHGATGEFTTAEDGAILGPGDTIRTAAGARAVLTYFEGSTVEIEPGSELAIQTAHGNPDGSTVIVMQQEIGTTWHVVTRLIQGASKYEVHTTASTASVRGTSFTVAVEPDGTTTQTTTEGAVANSDAASTTTVVTPPGQQTTTRVGRAPEPPKPAPEPERKVTVTVGDTNTIVVDMFGRANGITKDGKKVVQTPGAQVNIVDGKLVITLPNVPDGDLATHFQNTSRSDDVTVTTKVEDKGKKAVEVTETLKPSTSPVTGAEVKKINETTDGTTVNLKKVSDVKAPKVGEILPTPTTDDQQKAAELEKTKGSTTSTSDSSGKTNDKGAGTIPTIVNAGTTDPSSTTDAETKAKEDEKKKADDAKKKEDETKTTPTVPTNGFAPGVIVPEIPTIAQPTSGARTGEITPPKIEAPKIEAPKIEAPKIEAPKPEAPKPEAPKPEAPKPEAPKPETGSGRGVIPDTKSIGDALGPQNKGKKP